MERGRGFALCFVTASLMALYGCGDDGAEAPSGCDKCDPSQVCSGAGICYDDAACEVCGADQVCVVGVCYDNGSKCAECEADQACVGGVCYEPDSACAKCQPSQVCQNSRCYDVGDPCLSCEADQACVGGRCYEKTDPCARCRPEQVCVNGSCYAATHPCASCGSNQVCVGDKCYDESEDCIPACEGEQVCIDGQCRDCSVMCGGECCNAGEICDSVDDTCAPSCSGGVPACRGDCCLPSEICDPTYGCIASCSEEQTRCDNEIYMTTTCCDPGMVCEEGACMEDCKGGARCDGVCCAVGEVCEEKTCKIACDAATHTRCGEEEEFCCDNAAEVCVSQKCVRRGKPCTKSSQCNFDEVCEESSQSCINADEIASACEVRPEPGTFSPLLQFNWPRCLNGGVPSEHPSYIRVIVMPIVANMTDDNGDGVVNEDDVPDIVFIAYPREWGPDAQAPSVLRVISGDDGHEIASSAPRYWTYPVDAVVADIDNDGKTEIILGTNNNRVYTWKDGKGVTHSHSWATGMDDVIEALGVEPDASSATGFKLVTKYSIPIGKGQKLSFLSVADLDGDGTPEVLSNYGVVSVVNGAFEWRKGCENKAIGYVHAADLDGDGKMEMTNGGTIYDDHCGVLATGGVGGQIAIADLMESGADAAETGELVPEIAHVINGRYYSKANNGGKFVFSKVFKKLQEDGTYKWSFRKVWENPIPVDEKRWASRCNASSSHCYTGGGTPVVADFDGDTIPDVGVATRYYYIVYSNDYSNDGTPNSGKVLWADGNTTDYSSAVTGSSVFDFEGDGKAEVVYADEYKLRIYAGEGSGVDEDGDGYNDPKIIWETNNRSATGYEYPIIVDVDNDGSTEIVLSSDIGEGEQGTVGINVYEDPGAQWVRTRRIWNQHFYHVTNINEDGTVPQKELANWTHKRLNNYRQNVQPAGVFNAPDLVAKALTSETELCPESPSRIKLVALVANEGSLGIKAGLGVKFYATNVNGTGKTAFIGESSVNTVLPPKQTGTATLVWDQKATIDGEVVEVKSPAEINFVIDEPTAEKKYGNFVECNEENNALTGAAKVDLCPEQIN